ncbi:MFS transporter [Novosphingobium sp.]|uniref:MFS transporter n=1 Tax=Novosphingobium sp. TaxID=1874826 RepID=UPI0038BB4065
MIAPSRAWYVVAIVCAMAVLSYLDRYIIALLAEPIIAEFAVTATDIGLLIGLGFGLVYAIAGLPLAHWLDHGTRVRIVAGGVLLWSLSTASSGLAPNYPTLLASRVGVAIGEAVLVPATISLIADLFPAERRTLPIAIFMATCSLMGSGAFILGGLTYRLAGTLAPALDMEPWRITLLLVGLPGLFLAPLFVLTVREPARTADRGQAAGQASVAVIARYLRDHAGYYVPFYLALGIAAIGTYSLISWTTSMLARSYGMPLDQAGSLYGTVGLSVGIVAAAFWPAASGLVLRKGRMDLTMALLAAGLGTAHLAMAALALIDSRAMVMTAIGVAIFGIAASGSLAVLIIQSAAPSRMRARITSLYVLVGNLIGLTLGPPLSAWISEHVFAGPHAMRDALALLGAIMLPIVLLLLIAAQRGYRRALSVGQQSAAS